MEFFTECGDMSGDIVVYSDQVPVIGYRIKDIAVERGDDKGYRMIVEESPVRSKASSGVVERAA